MSISCGEAFIRFSQVFLRVLMLTAGDWDSQVIAWFDFAADDESAAPIWKRVKQTLPLGAAIIFDGDHALDLGTQCSRAQPCELVSFRLTWSNAWSTQLITSCCLRETEKEFIGSPQIAASFVTWKKSIAGCFWSFWRHVRRFHSLNMNEK